jgi:hypothetical protein
MQCIGIPFFSSATSSKSCPFFPHKVRMPRLHRRWIDLHESMLPFCDTMNHPLQSHSLKRRVIEILKTHNPGVALREILRFPLRSVVNPLFSLIQDGDESVKWAAVRAMGAVVAKLADQDMEAARIIMRRLMWNLNDESGGIGWGSPEAMAEILATHDGLAREYARILISYLREDGNLLENEVLQAGVLWGIGRVAEVHPDLVKTSVPHLKLFLNSANPNHRGLAARIMGLLHVAEARSEIEGLTKDATEIMVFLGTKLQKRTVGELAQEALEEVECGKTS